MAKRGRPKLGEGEAKTVRLTISLTTNEYSDLSREAEVHKKSLARLIVEKAMVKDFPQEIAKEDLEILIQIAERCGGNVATSIVRYILTKRSEF